MEQLQADAENYALGRYGLRNKGNNTSLLASSRRGSRRVSVGSLMTSDSTNSFSSLSSYRRQQRLFRTNSLSSDNCPLMTETRLSQVSDNIKRRVDDDCDDVCDTNNEDDRVDEEDDNAETMNDIPEDELDNENKLSSPKKDDENNNTIPCSLPSQTGKKIFH